MKNLKKCLALMLSLVMILTYIPTGVVAYALDDTGQTEVEQQVEAEASAEDVSASEEEASEETEAPAEDESASEEASEETETSAEDESASEEESSEDTETSSEDETSSEEEVSAEEASEDEASPEDDESQADEQAEAEEGGDEQETAEETAETEDEKEAEKETEKEAASEKADTKELVAGNDKYEVRVSYDADAKIPEGASLTLTEFKDGDKEFKAAKAALMADEDGNSVFSQTKKEDQEGLGMAAFDLTIRDKDGKTVEPKSEVKVSFNLKKLPEGVDVKTLASSMEIQHLKENSGDVVVEKIATFDTQEAKANDEIGEVKVDEKKETIKAETVVDGFSTYTITWGNAAQRREVILHFVDDRGNDLGTGFTYNGQSVDNGTTNLVTLIPENGMFDLSQFKKDGYSLSNVHIGQIGDMNGNTPTIIRNEVERADNALRYWTFNTGSDTAGVARHDFPEGTTDLYLVYNSTAMADPGSGGSGGGDTPDLADLGHNKVANSNNDGTYKLSLSVTGSAQNQETDPHVNVIVVFDTSSSMVSNYIPDNASMTRLEAAKDQVNELAAELLAINTEEHPEAVEMALVTFNRDAGIQDMGGSYWTKSASTFTSVVGTYRNGPRTNNSQGTAGAGNTGINTAKGTNWAQGLQKTIDLMQSAQTDDDPTYVLFITDGAPSQYWPSGQATGTYAEGEGCYLGARDEARRLVGGEGAILYALFTYGSQADYDKDYLGKLVDYAYNNSSAKNDYRFNVADNETFKKKLKAILGIISMNFAYANVSLDDGITGLSTVVFERIATDSFTYSITYKDYSSPTEYTEKTITPTVNGDGSITIPSQTYTVPDGDSPDGLRTINTEQVTVTGAQYSEATKSVTWDMKKVAAGEESDLYLLEEGWTYTVNFDIWPSQVSYDLVAALNNGILEYGDPYQYTDENGDVVTVPFSDYKTQVTDTRPYTLLTNTHFTIKYQQVTEVVNPDGTTSYELGPVKPIEDPYTYQMPLVSQEMPVKKVFAHSINAQDPYTKVRFYLMMDGEYYQSDGTLSETLVPYTGDDEAVHTVCMDLDDSNSWTGSVYIAPGVIKDERTSGGQMLVLETGHAYTLHEEVLEGPVYEYEFTPQTVRPMVVNGVLTFLVKEDKYNKPSSSDTIYEMDGENYFPAPANAQMLIGTNRKTAELDITKIVNDPDGLLTEEQENKESFTYRVTLMIPDGTDPAGIVGYEYVPRVQDNAFLLYGYQETDEGQGFPEDVDRFSGETYRAWNTLVYRDLIEWETVDGKVKAKTDENGNILWLIPAVDGYHTITYDMTLKQDEVIRFTNLPSGTKYTIQEIYANKYPADNTGGTTSGRPPVADPGNLEDQGYEVTRIQSTGVNEETAEISEAGDTISGVISNLDARYYNQFTNTISDFVEVELKVTKHIDGYNWSGERYYFDLSSESETAPLPGGNGGRTSLYTKAASGSDDVTQSFGRVRFTSAGEYTYTIQERTPTDPDDDNKQESDRLPDVVYDTTEKKVTVVVKVGDDGLYIDSITGEDGSDYLVTDSETQPASATVTVTNKIERGDLDVTKTVVSSLAGDKTKAFKFKVTLSDTGISGTYGGMTFTDGVAEFTLSNGQTKSAKGLLAGVTYTVEEEAADGFITTKTGETGEITTTKATAAFTNTKKEGGLVVSKSVDSPVPADKAENTTYEITVTLDDTTVSGTYGDMTFTEGVATFELADGGTIRATGLADGLGYTVQEKAYDLFTTTYTGKTGKILDKETASAEVKNERKLGDLDVTKTVESDLSADSTRAFSFTVQLDDETISGTFGDVTFENGSASFTMSDGDVKHVTGLPIGVGYTVSEASDDDFTAAYTGETGEIAAEKATAAVTNTRKTGDLALSKVLVSDAAADADVEFTFTVELSESLSKTYGDMAFTAGVATVVLKGGETKTAEGIPAGVTYKITEGEATGFDLTGKTGDEGTITTTKSEAEFTNTRQTGDLDVTKTVVSSDENDKTKTFGFKVTLSDTGISGTYGGMTFTDGVAEFTLSDSQTKSAEGLPTGISYTVEEGNAEGFITRKTGETGEITTTKSTAAFINRNPSDPEKTVFSEPECKTRIDGQLVQPGQELTYSISYKNETWENADITITDKIPEHTTYVENSATNDGVFKNGTLTWTFKDVAPEEEITVSFTVKVDSNDSALEIRNKGIVQEGDNSRETNEVFNSKPVKDVFESMDSTVSIDGETVTPGQNLVYSITYENKTGETAKVTITDKIPAHTSYIKGSATENGKYADGTVTWNFDEVAPDTAITVKFMVKVDEDSFGVTIPNTATVKEGDNSKNTNEVVNTTPVRHDPPVLKRITGSKPKNADIFRFQLIADSTDAGVEMPMPKGSSGKTCTIETKADVEKEFGTLIFTKPGNYYYSVKEVNTGLAGYKYDTSVYKLHYFIEKESDGKLVMTLSVTKDGKDYNKSYYEFSNEYNPKETPTPTNPPKKTPNTGDANNLGGWLALMMLAGAGCFVLLYARRRRRNQ